MRVLVAALLLVAPLAAPARPDAKAPPVERNVVYGMYSGLALLLDVHRPVKSNGRGIVFISGSGWQAGLEYGAGPLKEQQIGHWGPALTAAGYTVFALNHRAAPRFHHPAALEDVQRAIRFVRAHARDYGIDPGKLGGVAGSSGAHLIALAATLGAPGDPADADPVNREPATLQAMVLRAAPLDLERIDTPAGVGYVASYLEAPPSQPDSGARQASPLTHVRAGAPPALLLHGDADAVIPYAQSTAFEAAYRAAGAPVKLVTIPGGAHAIDFGSPEPRAGWPDYRREGISWLDRHLR